MLKLPALREVCERIKHYMPVQTFADSWEFVNVAIFFFNINNKHI